MKLKSLLLALTLFTSLLASVLAGYGHVSATNYGGIDIINDRVMNDTGAMSASQINTFLNRFAGTCIGTNSGFTTPDPQGYSGGAYQFGSNVDAGTAIRDIAVHYNLNPQVLIATLEKEQGLIDRNGGCSYSNPASAPATYNGQAVTCGYGTTYTDCSYACQNTPAGGCTAVAVGYDCPFFCKKSFNGFSPQISGASWVFRFAQARAEGLTTGYPGYDSGDEDICYSGPMTPGFRQRSAVSTTCDGVPGNQSIYYDGSYTDSNGDSMYISDGATASMLNYTPFYANSYLPSETFVSKFTQWFGSPTTPAPTQCNSTVANIVCVWSLRKSDGSQLLTSSQTELYSAMYQYGWTNEGIAFYAAASQTTGTTPVYRLQQNGTDTYYFTADATEDTSLINSGNWTDEGTAFYASPSSTSNSSYQVDKLYDSSTGKYDWTVSGQEENFLLESGYQLQANVFNSFSGFISPPTPATGRDNIYQEKSPMGYFYTTNLGEVDATVSSGWTYQGVVTTADASHSSTPVYRLRYGTRYFYTTSSAERDLAVNSYGYTDEGIGFYVDSTSGPLYRLANTITGAYAYVNDIGVVMSLVNKGGWTYQGPLVSSSVSPSPVYRFISTYNGSHFYTIDINEATQIANKNGWQFETIAFNADAASGAGLSPVYRLRIDNKYLYTSDSNEENIAINKYGYSYEGVAFYVSSTTTSSPVYRLQKGNDYLFTASSAEMNSAINNYNYQYEGIVFYLPSS